MNAIEVRDDLAINIDNIDYISKTEHKMRTAGEMITTNSYIVYFGNKFLTLSEEEFKKLNLNVFEK